jgi:amino acid adenylation domain-containing protein
MLDAARQTTPRPGPAAETGRQTANDPKDPEPPAPPTTRVAACLRREAARALAIEGTRLASDRPLVAQGLDSLAAAELAAAIETDLGVQVPLASLIEGATLEELAAWIGERLTAPVAKAETETGEQEAAAEETVPPQRYPLSWGQRALWLLDRLAPGNPAYVLAGAGRIGAGLDPVRLRRALAALVLRHAALRTTFEPAGDGAVQVVHGEAACELIEEEAAGWSAEALSARLVEEAHRPFDLERGPLLRVALFHGARDGDSGNGSATAGGECIVLLAVHHLVADFWSLEVMLAELGALYRGQALPPPARRYGDFVRRQAELLAGAEGRRLAAYWTAALAAPAPPLELPADRPRPARQGFRGAAREARLPRGLTQRLHGLGRAAGATPFITLLAGFMTLLHRTTGQDELRVGTPAAGRSAADLSGVVGYLVNPLVLRGDLSAAPGFGDLLAQVRETALGAFAHQDYPFPLLAQRLGGDRDPSRPPVFQAMFTLYRERRDAGRGLAAFALGQAGGCLDLGGPVVQSVPLPRRAAQVELSLLAAEIDGALACSLQFNSDLFDGATIARMLRQLETLLLAVAGPAAGGADGIDGGSAGGADGGRLRRPVGELPLLGAAERHQLLEWCDTAAAPAALAAGKLPPAAAAVHELFEWQAARSPRAVAVAGQGMELSYGELERRANQLARYLRRLGAGPEVPVALCVDRTPEMVVALLGILKAGGAYVPLDPGHPPQRLRLVLADSGAPLLVCEQRWLQRLGLGAAPDPGPTPGAESAGPLAVCLDREREWIAAEEDAPLGIAVPAESLAYVIYTSGSTGLPKGVGLPHRALVCFLRAMAERPGLGAGDVMAALTTLAFDIAGLEIYLPLAVGGRVEVVGAGESADGRRLAARLAAAGVTAVQATPATWRLLLDAGWQGGAGLKALCGGEALPWDLAAALLDRELELWNMYGPTETAVWSATARVGALPPDRGRRADGGAVALGRAIANTRFAVVDRRGQPLPPGVAGELLIGGAGVARGYWRRPELTAERFVPDPASSIEGGATSPAGARRYRTGDLVRWRPDGELEFLGRIDHQVKVRGHRIELGEVESALARLPGVGQAVVAARGAGTDRRLVAYLVPHRDPSPAATAATAAAAMPGFAELRGLLRQTLPEYMLPADFVVLDRLPINASGKVDRRALPAPPPARPDGPPAATDSAAEAASPRRIAPRTPAEELIAGVWAEVLDFPPSPPSPPPAAGAGGPEAGAGGGSRPAIAVDDDFFRLGGHSLLAVRVAARLRDTLGVELPLARLLQLSRLEDLAREVESLAGTARPRAAPIARLPRPPRPPHEAAEAGTWESALSFAQERLWFIEQLEPGGATYNEPRALRLAGRLDVAALAASLGQIRRRHEVLRTRFAAAPGTGVPVAVAVAAPAWQVLPLPIVDLAGLPAASGETAAARLVTGEARRPFDLAHGPLIRAALLRLAPERHVLLLNLHHMVSDGGSLEVLARELAVFYGAAVSGSAPAPGALPKLSIQYADFAHWQRELLAGEDLAAAVGWWREQLGGSRGEPPRLDLPLDPSRPQAPTRRGRRRAMALPGGLTGELEAVARRHGVTLFMTLLAAFGTLLSRYGGQEDVTVGTPVAKRDRPETENLIGLFVNTLVLRLDLAADPDIGELLVRTRQTALAAYAHQDVPFDRLVTELAPQRGPAETPFFQVFFALQPPPPVLPLPGLVVEYLDPDSGTAKFDLSLAFHRTAAGALAGSWTWRRDLFEAATVERLAGQWRNFLAGLAAAAPGRHLSDLSLLAPAERHQLLQEWGTAPWEAAVGDLVHAPFLRQASLHPDRVALLAPWPALAPLARPAPLAPPAPLDIGDGPGTSDALGPAGAQMLTYGALAARAGALARSLRSLGVGPEEIVGICAETSPAMVAGLLGILQAGGAYLPLAPTDPRQRIAQLLAAAGARVAVADRAAAERLPAGVRLLPLDREPETPQAPEPTSRKATSTPPLPETPAYLLYTSGSTGVPKGVVVPHRAVANRLRFQLTADLRPGARVLHRTRLGFDVSVVEIFAPLWAGATVVLTPPSLQQDAAGLARLILEQEVTNFNAPPALLSALLAEESLDRCRSLRKVVTGSDRVPADLPRRYYSAQPAPAAAGAAGAHGAAFPAPPPLVARYGPTEATVSVSEWHCRPGSSALPSGAPLVPLGRPIASAQLRVLDRRDLAGQAAGSERVGNELPPGAPGELCIAGPGLARGYLGRPDLTAAAFLPDPFARQPETAGGRLYRTGDLARFRGDGSLEFLGRIDNQVKVRGYRVEVGEVEAALQSHPAVERAVVAADRAQGGRLAAYLVARRPQELDAAALRAYLGGKLPEYMIPAVWIEIPAVPLNANGKVDRRALPEPAAVAAGRAAAAKIVTGGRPAGRAALRTPAEELLADVWAELLGIEEPAPGDDFFTLGGHSLLATQLVSRVRGLFGVELPLRRVFEHPTLQALAQQIVALSNRQQTDPAAAPIARTEPAGPAPLSFAQQRLWFVDQLYPGSPAYNLPSAHRLSGPLDVPALAASFAELVHRHEILRTVFARGESGPVQTIGEGDDRRGARLPFVDLAALPPAAREAEMQRRLGGEARRPFDLTRGPMLRAALLGLGRDAHVLLFTLHHIAADSWSVAILSQELAALYEALRRRQPPRLPALPIHYADYAIWQRRRLTGAVLEAELCYWRENLAGAPPVLALPTDRPRPPEQSFHGRAVAWRFDARLSERLRAFGRRLGATPFMTLLGGFATLLARYGGQSDISIGTPIAGRNRLETERLIGFFVNTLVVRCNLAGDPGFAALLARVRQQVLEAHAHQELPFELLVEALQPKRSLSHEPLFQVMTDFQSAPRRRLALAELEWHGIALRQEAVHFDLALTGEEPERSAGWLGGSLEYRSDLFDGATALRLLGHLEALFAAAVAAPDAALSELPLLSAAERQQLRECNDTAVARAGDPCLGELIARQAQRCPEAVAVVFEGEALSFGELDRRAARLAARLALLGVGPETPVGIAVERSLEMMIGLVAILKAGGAYLPLDPAYPRERLAFMLADSQGGEAAPVMLSQRRLASQLPAPAARVVWLDDPAATDAATAATEPARSEGEGASPAQPAGAARVLPENLVYVIYTSGSTGRPKGALNSHRAVVNRLLWMQETYRLTPADRVLQKTPISFDVSVWELFWPLLTGATLVMARPGGHQEGAYLVKLIAEQAITTLHFVPSMLQVFLATPGADALPSLARVFASGEALPAELARRFHQQLAPSELLNLYGPTEAAVDVTAWRCDPAAGLAPVPIGRPVANTAIHLLDPVLRPVPLGVPGELYIGGVQLARGYLKRPELTAERFLPDPRPASPGARIYRTGDLARRRTGGEIEFLGRIDHQIKLRGFRIELGEIEAALTAIAGVREAAVLVREDGPAGRRLAAHLAGDRQAIPAPIELRARLLRSLPEHMVPAAFIVLDALPLSANGKLDRKALAALGESPPQASDGYVAPRDPIEQILAGIWEELLGRRPVGVHEDFFALGGHSLLATQVVSRLQGVLQVEVPVRRLFEARTVAAFAVVVEQARAAAAGAALPAGLSFGPAAPAALTGGTSGTSGRGEEAPLSFAQQRLWFVDQLEMGSVAYNMAFGVELTGELGGHEVIVLRRTLTEIVRRHQALRTRFASTPSGPVQIVEPPAAVAVPVVCLAALPATVREGEAHGLTRAQARRPFKLSVLPLMRLALLRLAPRRHLLLAVQHHIISDGWSAGVMLHEVAVLYSAFHRGLRSPLPKLPIQYPEFARWQRQWLQGEVLEDQLAYWRGQLAGAPRQLELPADRPRALQPSRRGGVHKVALPEGPSQRLAALSRREEVTLFMTLAAAFGLLLGRHANQEELLLGTPIANRNRHETEALIGFFVNTLVLRLDLTGRPTFTQLLRRVHDVALGAYAHQDLPFERLIEEAAAGRDHDPRQAPLIQAVLVLQNAPLETFALPGLGCRTFSLSSGSVKFDLTLSLGMRDGQLDGTLEYDGELFDAATARRLAARCEVLLEAIAAGAGAGSPIDELPLLSPAERHQVVREWGDAATGVTGGKVGEAGGGTATAAAAAASLPELFERQVRRAPGARAVSWQGDELTYGALNRRANQLAHRLRELGVGLEERVGLCVERSLELVVGVLGILKAGAAYVPIDPGYPRERRSFIAADAGLRVVVGTAAALGELRAAVAAVALDAEAEDLARRPGRDLPAVPAATAPANAGAAAAYVIYTSGSTGKPKGVVVTHANVIRLFSATWPWFRFGVDDVWTLFHSYAFDFSVWEIWGALLHGGRLVVVPYMVSRTPDELRALLVRERVTVLNQTPSAFAQLMRADEEAGAGAAPLADLRLVIFGGEALEPFRLAPWFGLHGDERPRLVNMYGITETTVHVTARRLLRADAVAGRGSVIGRPIPDLATYVLDAQGHPAPIGVAGELAIGGAGLARGYLGRPELTAERFVPDPFRGQRGEPGSRLYRSGDLGRFLPGGGLEYLGRIDNQVKIRGFRIEIEEVQAALAGHPQVREAVVLTKADPQGGGRRLVAYVVPRAGAAPAASDLRAFLSSRLPEHMVPAAFALLAALPLTGNGKVDRRALLTIATTQREESRDYQPAANEAEGALVEIWEQVLGLDRVGIDDRFFSLGGDSILSLRVHAAAAARGLHFTLPQLFEYQTVRELARHLEPEDAELAAAGDPEPFALLASGDRDALPGGLDDAYPLTALQQGMLFHSGFAADSSLYHNVASFKMAAQLDETALREAIALLLARHPVLRTSFDLSSYSEPLQLVHSQVAAPLAVEDLRGLDESGQERLLAAAFVDERQRKLDPGRAPLLRFRVHRLAEDRFQFTWTEHHAILDGWSVASMMNELFALYHSRRSRRSAEPPAPPPPPPPTASFRQFVALERRAMASEETRRHWERQLAGAPGPQLPLLPLPDGEEAQAPRVRDTRIPLGAPRTLALKRLAASLGVPLKSVLLAAHYRTLAVVTGQTELTSGLVVNGRPEVRDGERILGLFLNTLPLRFKVRPGSWSDLVRQAAAAERELVAYRRYPMAQIKVAARGGRDGRTLFDSAFNYNHFHVLRAVEEGEMLLDGNAVGDIELPYTTSFALDAASSRLALTQQFDERVLPAWRAEKIAGCMTAILDAMVARPDGRHDAAPLLGPAEIQQLVREWNDTAAARPGRGLHELFDEQAAVRPDAAALIAGSEVVTYGELSRRANSLACQLRSLGAGPEVRVALLLDRSPELIASIFAVLESGAAYVPLDPEYPPARLAAILKDSGARILLTRSDLAGALGEPGIPTVELDRGAEAVAHRSRSDPPAAAGAAGTAGTARGEGLAYVIYTSGSTGLPKGVLVSHASAVNTVLGCSQYNGLTPEDRCLQFSSINFDASIEDIFAPLLSGCSLVLRDEAMLGSPQSFLAAVEEHGISVLLLPTAFWHELAAALVEPELQLPRCLRVVDIGGERVRPEQVARWLARGFAGVSLVNSYGPTEITVVCTRMSVVRPAGRGQEVPIGRPMANSRVYLLGPDLQPLPQGAAGMLFVSGRGVARGYHGRPELTAERFLPDPWSGLPGARMYKTGDLAVHRPDGAIEFRGRGDDQVKIRGFRIEPGEIELVLAEHPAVRQAVVAVREDARRESALVAYVVAAGEAKPAAADLEPWLRERLPAFMMPAAFVLLDRLPVNVNGKLDQQALPAPDWGGDPLGRDYLAPRDALELRLAGLWQELLPSSPVGVRDDFFELGGHSLLAVQLMARIQKSLGRSLPTATLLRHPTIERLAALLRDGGQAAARTALVEMAPAGARPFFCVHPVGGDVLCYVHLARHLATGRRIFGLQVPERNGEAPWTTIEEMATHYLHCVRAVQPAGPYSLGGWSMGGMVAFEMARQLESQGEAVDQVVLIDAAAPRPGGGTGRGRRKGRKGGPGGKPVRSEGERVARGRRQVVATETADGKGGAMVAAFAGDLARLFGLALPALSIDLAQLTVEKALNRVRAEAATLGILPPGLDGAELDRRFAMFDENFRRAQCYAGGACAAPLLLLKAAETAAPHASGNGGEADLGWGRLAGGRIEVIEVPGDHYTLLQEPHVQTLASRLRERLGRSQSDLSPTAGP